MIPDLAAHTRNAGRALQAERATRDGPLDKSLQLMEHVELLLKKMRRQVLRQSTSACGVAMSVENVSHKLHVCDMCGAFLSIVDSERRLADHFGGKVHVGYVRIRKKLEEVMETIGAEQKEEGATRRHQLGERGVSAEDKKTGGGDAVESGGAT